MTGVYIVVAVLASLILGALICLVGFYLWTIRQTIIQLQKSVQSLQGTFGEMLGEGSFARISKGLSTISSNLPEMLEAFKEFSKVMSYFFKNAFVQDKPAPTNGQEKSSAFYGYDEAHAASAETADVNNSKILELSKEQLAAMRTESAE